MMDNCDLIFFTKKEMHNKIMRLYISQTQTGKKLEN